MSLIGREDRHLAVRIKVTHHKNDAVEAMFVVRGKPFRRALLQPLRGLHQAEAADEVARYTIAINNILQQIMKREESRGPTKEMDGDEG